MEISEELRQKKEDEANQIWTGVSLKMTQCRSCVYALPDTEYTVGAEKANCEVFFSPFDKPVEVMKGGKCKYHRAR